MRCMSPVSCVVYPLTLGKGGEGMRICLLFTSASGEKNFTTTLAVFSTDRLISNILDKRHCISQSISIRITFYTLISIDTSHGHPNVRRNFWRKKNPTRSTIILERKFKCYKNKTPQRICAENRKPSV